MTTTRLHWSSGCPEVEISDHLLLCLYAMTRIVSTILLCSYSVIKYDVMEYVITVQLFPRMKVMLWRVFCCCIFHFWGEGGEGVLHDIMIYIYKPGGRDGRCKRGMEVIRISYFFKEIKVNSRSCQIPHFRFTSCLWSEVAHDFFQ